MAEIELGTADGSDEIKVYDEVQDYLASGRYPETATKVDKRRHSETSNKVSASCVYVSNNKVEVQTCTYCACAVHMLTHFVTRCLRWLRLR